MTTNTISRPIRSFVRREGRITDGQKRALSELWPRFGIASSDAPDAQLNFREIFARNAPVRLEIGFGNGEALVSMAAQHPDIDFVGIEVHRPGVGRLLSELAARELANVRVMSTDAKPLLASVIPPSSLDAIFLFFPDPWPKKRHHKRRLVQPDFVALAQSRLRIGGRLHLATDWEDYALHMMEVLSASGMRNEAGPGNFSPRPEARPLTKFERRGHRLGHDVWDLVFVRDE